MESQTNSIEDVSEKHNQFSNEILKYFNDVCDSLTNMNTHHNWKFVIDNLKKHMEENPNRDEYSIFFLQLGWGNRGLHNTHVPISTIFDYSSENVPIQPPLGIDREDIFKIVNQMSSSPQSQLKRRISIPENIFYGYTIGLNTYSNKYYFGISFNIITNMSNSCMPCVLF